MYFKSASLILKIFIFHSFNVSGSTFFSFTPTTTVVIKRSITLSTTFREINIRGKSISLAFRDNIANSTARDDI